MKITKVDVFMLDAGSQRWQRKPIVCRIYTDEGIYGDGEAGIAFGIGSTAAFGMVKDLAGLIVGMDPMNIEVIWNKMFKSSFWGMGGGADLNNLLLHMGQSTNVYWPFFFFTRLVIAESHS